MPAEDADRPGDASPSPRRHILLVSEDSVDTELLAGAFQEDGARQVCHVPSLAECLDLIKAHAPRGHTRLPDLVVVDVRVPDVVSARAVEQLKRGPLAAVPVVVLAELDDEDGVKECYEARAEAVLIKPIAPEALRETARHIARIWAGGPRRPPM